MWLFGSGGGSTILPPSRPHLLLAVLPGCSQSWVTVWRSVCQSACCNGTSYLHPWLADTQKTQDTQNGTAQKKSLQNTHKENLFDLHCSIISIFQCKIQSKIFSAGLMRVTKPRSSLPHPHCAFLTHSRRRWSGWCKAPTPAAPRRSSVRLSWTAHGCSPASCPTSSRMLTGEASSGPRCLELEGPRYPSGATVPCRGHLISYLWCLRSSCCVHGVDHKQSQWPKLPLLLLWFPGRQETRQSKHRPHCPFPTSTPSSSSSSS